MKIQKLIESTLNQYLNEQETTSNNLNKNFWKWFGNSKVIKNNKPIITYHGTDVDFNVFDKNKIGLNHWQSKSDAHGGGFFFTDKKNKASHGNVIKEVYLKIENPLIRKLEDRYGNEVDYYHATDMYDNNPDDFIQTAKENNNDGIIIQTPRGSLYIVFNPNQIKSIYNDGSWDVNDDNINS